MLETSKISWPAPRNTTHMELMQMHDAAESGSAESTDPQHYKTDGVECIDAIRDSLGFEGFLAYCRGNVMRYMWRLGKKDDPSIEAGKAAVYCQWIEDTLNGKRPRKL